MSESLDAAKAACKADTRQRPVMNREIRSALKLDRLFEAGPVFEAGSTLARLEAALNLVDHINPALAADQTVIAVTTAQRLQRVTDLHGTILLL
jgi:hypothetical protein